ncbi:retinoid-inducible serine carboxypeptidase-like [Physella acuta]|uniref:retinoid-inducible serine carboxypeptidase-like n=1 Tax=Physella acuta TaxID=109671 RepID=UPI0027DCC530|nr:retinoid-inducible serine carboxypeptidase-like [Physella acuta]
MISFRGVFSSFFLYLFVIFYFICATRSHNVNQLKYKSTFQKHDSGFLHHMSVDPLSEPQQAWNYVTVRPKAHLFYWLYYTTHPQSYKNRPLILWLQGGPGGSGTGFGNFAELGPLDVNLQPRNTTWLQTASLLFVDNPVGTGYSYAEDSSAFTTNVAEISADLLTLMKSFIQSFPDFKEVPFYIFSESYGGKMTADFSAVLYNAIQKGQISMNFQGFAMGDSWISPVDSVNSWGPFLYATSIVDLPGMNRINAVAKKVSDLVQQGKFIEATAAWSTAEATVESESAGVNFYNILDWVGSSSQQKKVYRNPLENLYQRHVGVMANDDLDQLMNGPIKEKLKIIPDHVTWGGQAGEVFEKQAADFMKNVTSTVNNLVNNSKLKVIIYSGQLDLICDVLGTETWFYKTIDKSTPFQKATKQDVQCDNKPGVCFYVKQFENLQFYWILDAGHMVPTDNGPGALAMVNKIIG